MGKLIDFKSRKELAEEDFADEDAREIEYFETDTDRQMRLARASYVDKITDILDKYVDGEIDSVSFMYVNEEGTPLPFIGPHYPNNSVEILAGCRMLEKVALDSACDVSWLPQSANMGTEEN